MVRGRRGPAGFGGLMKRFILITFAVLAFAFYEMSGGSDFQPRRPQLAEVKETPAPAASTPAVDTVTVRELVRQPVIAETPKPTTSKPLQVAATRPERPAANPNLRQEIAKERLSQVGQSLRQGLPLVADAPTQRLTLTSLERGAAGLGQVETQAPRPPADYEAPRADIREITATRVNMRAGPGTNHSIITRLNLGQPVEVLDDNGSGWLHLRSVQDDTIGWISAALVSGAP